MAHDTQGTTKVNVPEGLLSELKALALSAERLDDAARGRAGRPIPLKEVVNRLLDADLVPGNAPVVVRNGEPRRILEIPDTLVGPLNALRLPSEEAVWQPLYRLVIAWEVAGGGPLPKRRPVRP